MHLTIFKVQTEKRFRLIDYSVGKPVYLLHPYLKHKIIQALGELCMSDKKTTV